MRGEASPPDLLILDISMPAMDGVEVLRTIRRDPDESLSRQNVVMCTAVADDGVQNECVRLGVRDYWQKCTFDYDGLALRLSRVLA